MTINKRRAGRPTKLEATERSRAQHRQSVIDEVENIALDGAANAMRALVSAVEPPEWSDKDETGKRQRLNPAPSREAIAAATYVLNQVVGRPGEREPANENENALRVLMERLIAVRESPDEDSEDSPEDGDAEAD
jgi:hypothetical protein